MTQCTVEFLHRGIQVILKLFCLKVGLYSLTQFLYYDYKNIRLATFLQVKVSVVNSTCGSFCWNYVIDPFYSIYASTNVSYNYACFEVLLQLCGLVDLSVAIMQVTVSVAIM